MNKLITAMVVGLGALALAGCGRSDEPNPGASPDSVEMNADELPANDASAGAVGAPAPEPTGNTLPVPQATPADGAILSQSPDDTAARNAADNAGAVADAVKAAAANADAENAKH